MTGAGPFSSALAHLPFTLADFPVCPRDGTGLPAWVRSAVLTEGESALEAPFPELPLSAWLAFPQSGDRVSFETPYFTRRRLLNALVLAECAERKGRFMARIAEGVWRLVEESGWQLPAHNGFSRGGAHLPLPDPDRPVIDLFAAETAAQLAVAAQLLGPALEKTAPGLVARIDRELDRRLFGPYLNQHFWWMGVGGEPTNNWTAWCTQNVLLAVFCRPTSQQVRAAVVTRAAASLDAFFRGYGEDGACEEGVLYYRHAALCLFNAMLVLDSVTGGRLQPLWHHSKLRAMAEYIVHMHVEGPRYINFADSSAVLERCSAREYLFGQAVQSPLLAEFAATDWASGRTATLPEEVNLFYRVQAAFAAEELERHVPRPVARPDLYMPSVGVLTARDARFTLAVKAGHNGEGHNHNDVGSLTLYARDRPVLIDVGVETYTRKTFSSARYEIWTMQSAFHNLPSFEGVMQVAGRQFAARDVVTQRTADRASIAMDIAGAYPESARVRSYRRSVELEKGKAVRIIDTHDGDLEATLSLMVAQRPHIGSGHIALPGLATLALSGARSVEVDEIAITDARLRRAWPDRLYRCRVRFSGSTLRVDIS